MKLHSQARLRRHRRYDAAGFTGRLEGLPRPSLRAFSSRRPIMIVVAVMVIGVVAYVSWSNTFYVTHVSVVGNTRTPPLEILQASNIGGKHILWVNHVEAAQRVTNGVPSIKSARVDCQLPNKCTIRVQEREPIIAWQFGGAVTWLADDGMAFAARVTNGADLNLISIEAPQGPALLPGKEADQKIVQAALAVAREIPDVRHYKYSVEHGLEFQDGRGFPVYLGLGENMADRAMVWKSLGAELEKRRVTPKFVDLRFPLAPYYVEQ